MQIFSTGKDPEPAVGRHAFRWAVTLPWITLAVLFLLIVLYTRSTAFGDTSVYVADIASVLEGRQPQSSLLDFGHLVWRPIGEFLTHPSGNDGASLRRQISLNLIYFNLAASGICAVAMWILMRLVKGISAGAALLSCAAFLATNGFIMLSRAGTAWMPGLACLLVACCCALQASRRNSLWLAICAAVLTAGSVVLWVPYVLSAITVACASLLAWEGKDQKKRLALSAVRILPLAGLITIIAFAASAYARQIDTGAELLDWVRFATHGEARDRQWLRMIFGLPRSFFIMGEDGVRWKQFLFHDPYAAMGLWEVLKAGVLKIALFYGVMGAMLLWLARTTPGRQMLLWAAAAVLPTVTLAIAFEAGSVERYLALYPAVFIALAWAMSQRSAIAVRALVVFFCGVLITTNLWANWKPRIDEQRAAMMSRVRGIPTGYRADGRPASTVYALNTRDELLVLYDPNDRSLDSVPRMRLVIPTLAPEIAIWRSLFGRTMLEAWDGGSEVWVTKRAWADVPRREWNWVEGDDWRVRWKDLRPVVSLFKIDADAGGPDGFHRIADTPDNRATAMLLRAAERR